MLLRTLFESRTIYRATQLNDRPCYTKSANLRSQ